MTHEIRITIQLSPRLVQGILVIFALTVFPKTLASESLTLSTTYPSPSGIYNQVTTLGTGGINTALATAGGFVLVGENAPQAGVTAKLQVYVPGAGINTALNIRDGNQATGLSLITDASGNASWGNATFAP